MTDAEDLFARHYRDVFRFLSHMTGRLDVAEDLVQDVFVRVVRALQNGGPIGHERGWIFCIARNLLADRHRDGRRRPETVAPQESSAKESQSLAYDLRQSLEQLPEEDREIFLLKEVGGLTYQEISEICRCTIEAVRARLYRTRIALRAMMTPAAGSRR